MSLTQCRADHHSSRRRLCEDPAVFTAHHCALSVGDVGASVAFYEVFGFRVGHRWVAADGSLEIVHLVLGGFVLELFGYRDNGGQAPLDLTVGGGLEQRGVKHLALRVDSLEAARGALLDRGIDPAAIGPDTHGRTGLDLFFVRDPDGIWVEVVRDERGIV
jgi:glyoxylase I family protein